MVLDILISQCRCNMLLIFTRVIISFMLVCGLNVFAAPLQLVAETSSINFERLSVAQGLPHNLIYSILEDSQGFLWFATYGGLSRYDGIRFQTYSFNPEDNTSLSSNSVYTIFEDSRQRIWVGTDGGGLNLLDFSHDNFIRFQNSDDETSLSNNQVRAIAEDSAGNIWVGTAEGLNLFDPISSNFTRYYNTLDVSSLSSGNIFSLLVDSRGRLWVGTAYGLNLYLPLTDNFIRYTPDPSNINSISNGTILALTEDNIGRIWLGSFVEGLDVYQPETNTFSHFHSSAESSTLSDNTVYSIYQDREGIIWVGTANGLNLCDPQTGQFSRIYNEPGDPASLSNNRVRAICQDSSGLIWIGTYGGGVCKLDPKRNAFRFYYNIAGDSQSLSNNLVFTLLEDKDGVIWVGTDGGGLNKLQPDGTFQHYYFQTENLFQTNINSIRALYQDTSGTIWIGTLAGLVKFDPVSGGFKHYTLGETFGNSVRTIYEDHSGRLWVGTFTNGLAQFYPDTGQFSFYSHDPENVYSLSNNTVYSILEDNLNNLWVATGDGLNLFESESGSFTHFYHIPNNATSLPNNHIFSLYADQYQSLWIATNGGGLSRLNLATMQFENFTQDNGLSSNIIYSLIGDDSGYIWLSTNKGISRFAPSDIESLNFDPYSGIKDSMFNWGACAIDNTGRIYFGGDYGFVVITPPLSVHNEYLAPVHITDISVNDIPYLFSGSVGDNEKLALDYTQRSLTIRFAVLDYTSPSDNKYRYMLEGFDKGWYFTDSSHPFATYTNLNPGKYVFRVFGANNSGVWTPISTDFTFEIAHPFWQTWWFLTVMILSFFTITYFGYRLRLKTLSDQRKRLEVKVHERTLELEQQFVKEKKLRDELEKEIKRRVEYTRSLVHELKTPLTPMVSASDTLANGLVNPPWHNLAEQLRQGAISLNNRIDELLDLAKGEIGILTIDPTLTDVQELLQNIIAFVSTHAKKQKHNLSLEISGDIPKVYLDRERIRQVLLNLLNNSFKFTPDGGDIWLRARKDNDWLLIMVEDNGAGFTPEQQKRLFEPYHRHTYDRERLSGLGLGLALSKILVELHGGSIMVKSTRHKGSCVSFRVPLNASKIDDWSEKSENFDN